MTDQRPSIALALGMFGIVIAAAAAAALVYMHNEPDLHLHLESFVVLAPIYFVAQAMERLLEPFAAILLPVQAEKERAESAALSKQRAQHALEASLLTELSEGVGGVGAASAVVKEVDKQQKSAVARLSKRKSERALVFFAIASVASLAVCSFFGLGILQAMSESRLEEPLRAIDVALTGIVIGAGTKPLHDLISRIEKAKEKTAG